MKKIFKSRWMLLVVAVFSMMLIAQTAAAAEEKKAPAAPALTPEDVTVADGVLTRTNAPAFTLDIVTTMEPRPLSPGNIYSAGQEPSPFSVQVAISDVGKDGFEAWVKGAGEGWVAALKGLGSKEVEILRSEPIDVYDEFKAYEMEIEWLWTDGSTVLTNINHYILKGDKVITLSGTLMGDPGQLTGIYETIDLDP